MRKILSFVAAFLFAAGMMADPVVLPAVLDVSNVSFRSEGMPDFVIEAGQEYAGTYFDMGAHDSSNDTLLYAEWDVTIQPIKYNLAVDVYNTNSWRVQLYLLNQAGDTVKSLRYKGSSGQCGQFAIGSLDLSDLAAGNYKVRARAATAWSAMKLKDVIFQADYQGVTVALPDTLLPAYALLSSGATVANNAIAFAPATANTEYAIWNVSFAEAGTFNVTVDMTASNGHTYGVALLSADGATGIDTVAEAQAWDTGVKELGAITVPAAGNYKVKLTNATQWSEAVINSIVFATPIIGAPAYFLVGNMNNWKPDSAYMFAVNPANENEYMLTKTLAVGDSMKVVEVVGNTTTWYPAGTDNDYVVDAAHAGEKTIYFQTTYKADWAEFGGYFWMEANPAPEPTLLVYSYEHVKNSSNSAYNTAYDVTVNEMQWSVMANFATDGATRFGGKSLTNVDKPMYTKQAITEAIDSVIIRHYGTSSDKLIVNSIKMEVASDAAFANILDTVTLTPTIGKNDTNVVKFTLTNAVANSFYRITYNLSNSNNSNYAFMVYRIDFYKKSGETPVEVKYSLKNNWGAGEEWTWKEMTKDGNNYKLENVVFGGTGVNYKSDLLGAPELWVPVANFLGDVVEAKDTVTFVLNPADSTITATLLGKFEPEPVPGCNWAELPYLGGPAEYANQYKVCTAGEQPGVVNIQKPGFAREYGIYMTFPSAAFDYTSFDTTKCDIQGAGVVFHLSAFTAKITDMAVVCDNTPILFSVYNENGLVPEVKYSLKNNWGAGEEWTWKEMTKDGDNYKLENVVFGGTGVNYKSDLLGAPELWVPMANFLGDTIAAKDTVTFVLNPADSTITATLIGKYVEPAPEPVIVYNWSNGSTQQIGTQVLGTGVELSTVKIHNNTLDLAGIKFGSSYVYAEGKYLTIKPAEGGFKAGDILFVAPVFTNADTLTKFAQVDIYAADGATRLFRSDSASTINGRVSAADPIVQAYIIESAQDSLLLGRYGNTAMFITQLYVTREEAPEPVHTYTVAGAPATLFGQDWAPSYAANDMEHLVGSEYLYIWAKDSVTLPAGNIQFKVCEDHAWTHAWPSQNYVLPIAESGIYNIAIYFNPLAEADSLRIRATADKVASAVVIPAVKMHGNFTGSWADTKEFTLAADSLTASLKLNLAEGNFEFGMKFDGTWKANGANITRTENTACLATGDGNMHIAADQEGEYTFTYTFETQTLAVTYPKLIQHYNVAEAIAAGLQENDLVYVRGIVTKMEFKGANFAKYGSVNIYVADATGAEGEFEFYNCYSLNADTFRTSDPAYDATSTAWAQFQAVTDGNGKTVHVGDMVEAYGKYKLYNTTHELNTGCYLTLIEEPAPSIIYDVKLFNRDWSADTISTVTWDGINEKVIINIIPGKNDAWQGQVWLKLPMDVKKEKEYDLTFKIKANKTFGGSIVKYQENAEMLFDNQLALTADVETIYESKNMPGVLAAGDVTGNGVLCMSFGYCPDSTLIEMYAISIVEHDPTTVPAKFYVTGNDAFTVDAGKTTADSWNVKAFKSEADTMTFALKAGAEYQIKLSVDGTWNTAKGYNDLTEVTPGIIDADGNNHNIGFSLVEDGDVMVIYTGEVFKVVGNFVTQGLNDIDASVKAVKVLRNGQIFIIRGDKVYTVTGQPVK